MTSHRRTHTMRAMPHSAVKLLAFDVPSTVSCSRQTCCTLCRVPNNTPRTRNEGLRNRQFGCLGRSSSVVRACALGVGPTQSDLQKSRSGPAGSGWAWMENLRNGSLLVPAVGLRAAVAAPSARVGGVIPERVAACDGGWSDLQRNAATHVHITPHAQHHKPGITNSK
jgi:hypothetical protein